MTGEDQRSRAAAFKQLLAIRGVVGVGWGWKERGGRVVSTLAYRVYVPRKRRLEVIPLDERIPLAIDGVPTDVHVFDDVVHAGAQPAFLTPGCQIARYVPGHDLGGGTLTLLVQKDGKHHALSCDHVFAAGKHLTEDALDVYSPQHTSCDCRTPFAVVPRIEVPGYPDGDPVPGNRSSGEVVVGEKHFRTDVALAEITASPATGTNLITLPDKTTVTLDQGLIDYSTLPSTVEPNPDSKASSDMRSVNTPPTVYKLGTTTSYTAGQVVQLSAVRTFEADPPPKIIDVWEMTVTPMPGKEWSEKFQLEDPSVIDSILPRWDGKPVTATNLGNGWIGLSGHVFALPGDSGSPVWDDARKLVGIVTAVKGVDQRVIWKGKPTTITLPNGLAVVQYAPVAFQALSLTASSILAPGVPLSGTRIAVPRTRPRLDLREVAVVRRAVKETERGRQLLALVTRHLETVTELVHHRRHVKVVWHRNRGPAFAAAVLEALRDPTRTVPEQIAGVTFEHALGRFIDVLKIEGDEPLVRDLELHGPWITELLLRKQTMQDVLASLSHPTVATA